MDKSIEERAKKYSKKQCVKPVAYNSYITGATEQKAIDDEANYKQGYHDAVKKACKWMKEQVYQEYGGGPLERLIPDTMIENFMKNMEE